MASYIIRQIDPEKWKRVRAKAALEGRTVRQVIDALVDAWLKEKTLWPIERPKI